MKNKNVRLLRRERGANAVLLGPMYLFTVIFLVGPFVYMIVLSFLSRAETWGVVNEFTLRNYLKIFEPTYLSTFWESIKLAFLVTALVILSSGVLDDMMSQGITGTRVAQTAFSTGFGGLGPKFVAVCLLFFAFSTIIGWYFFAQQNVKYLFGNGAVRPFALLVVICVFLGSLMEVPLVWNLSDLLNGIMVIPNFIALIALSGVIASSARK